MPPPQSHLTAAQRVAGIKAKAAQLTRRVPQAFQSWDVGQTRTFKAAIRSVDQARTLPKALEAANTLAAYYGLAGAQLDPGEVSS